MQSDILAYQRIHDSISRTQLFFQDALVKYSLALEINNFRPRVLVMCQRIVLFIEEAFVSEHGGLDVSETPVNKAAKSVEC